MSAKRGTKSRVEKVRLARDRVQTLIEGLSDEKTHRLFVTAAKPNSSSYQFTIRCIRRCGTRQRYREAFGDDTHHRLTAH
jgi:hypothetical protein